MPKATKRPPRRADKKTTRKRGLARTAASDAARGPGHPAKQYIADVLAGRITVCLYVRQAIERHVVNLQEAAERGIYFDEAAGQHIIDFFQRFLKHSKGEWAGRPLLLEPWQQAILWMAFGWRRTADGTRLYHWVYIEVARKNGKSTMGAGTGTYLLIADDEPGAEVYSAATKRDQAIIIHSEAVRMVRTSSALASRIRVQKNNLSVESTHSKFEPLGADDDTLDGLNVHGAIIDEVHAHKTSGVVDVLDTATGARRQPMQMYLTTAGFDRNSICWRLREHTLKVLEGTVRDDAWFGVIYTLDEGDDWHDEKTWIKANPNLGVSVKIEDMRLKARRADEMPTRLNDFLRKHMNVWTQQDRKWANMAKWKLCGETPLADAMLAGRECIGAFDLSVRRDLSAWAEVYRLDDRVAAWWHFWIPRAGLEKKERDDRAPYLTWADQGYITLVDGDTMDYDLIREFVLERSRTRVIREIAFDPANAIQLCNDLQADGFNLIEHRQGMLSMSPPTKHLDELIAACKLLHGNNPVATWMMSNAVAVTDSGGNVKLTKDPKQMTGRIDGIIAMIMGLGRLLADPQAGSSIYETQGLDHL